MTRTPKIHAQVQVGEQEILIAQRGVRTRCAIAAAIMKRVPHAQHIKVSRDEISWLDAVRRERLVFDTPPEAVEFIQAWDSEQQVEPLNFVLTDAALVDRRPVRQVSTRQRIKRPVRNKVHNPGSRMRRPPQDPPCAPNPV